MGTFALSEPQPLTGLIFSLFAWLGHNPILAYNLVLLLFLTLNAISAEFLLRKLGIKPTPSFLGGLLALALPFVSNEWGVLQLTAVFPLFFTLSSLLSFARNPGWRSALGIGIWSAASFLTSSYYGLFLTLFLLLGGVVLLKRHHLQIKVFAQFFAGLVTAVLLLFPVLPEQIRLTSGYSRSETTIQNNSAEPVEYSHLYRRTFGEIGLPWIPEDDGSQRLFPGTILLVLSAIGIVVGVRQQKTRRWAFYALIGTAVAFIVSLGLNLSIGEWQPYRILKDYYPGFAQLRSPFRMAVFVQLFLVTLAGIGLNAIWRHGRFGRFLAIALVAAGLVEVVPWPARLTTVPETAFESAWIDWLKEQPDEGAVLMLPMSQDSSARAFEPTVIGMLQGLEHGRPLGNGYSGYFPTSYRSLKGRMIHFPDNDTVQYLQETGFAYLVIDQAWWSDEMADRLTEWAAEVVPVFEDAEKIIYRLDETR
jgi:hypothetical protein